MKRAFDAVACFMRDEPSIDVRRRAIRAKIIECGGQIGLLHARRTFRHVLHFQDSHFIYYSAVTFSALNIPNLSSRYRLLPRYDTVPGTEGIVHASLGISLRYVRSFSALMVFTPMV